MLSEVSQRKTHTVLSHLYVESKKKVKLLETERRRVVARGCGMGGNGEVDERLQTLNFQMNKA